MIHGAKEEKEGWGASKPPYEVEAWISVKFRAKVAVDPHETIQDLYSRIENAFAYNLGHSVAIHGLLDCNFNDLPPQGKVGLMVRDQDRIYVILNRETETTWYRSSEKEFGNINGYSRISRIFKKVFDAREAIPGPHSIKEIIQSFRRMEEHRTNATWDRAGLLVAQMDAVATEIDRLGNYGDGRCRIEIRMAIKNLRDGVVLLPDVITNFVFAIL